MAQSIERQLAKILASNTKMANGKTVRQNLEGAVDYLYECLDNQIRAFYALQTKGWYKRTFNFMNSLYAENFFEAKVNGTRIELNVSFRDSMAFHRNVFNDHDSYVPILQNFGYKWQGWTGEEDRFHYYKGFHMVEKAIIQFNQSNPYGIYISPNDVVATYNGREIDNRYWLNNKRW